MTEMVLAGSKRERFCRAWLLGGMFIFVTSFFWASGTAPLRGVFYIFILVPWLMILPWRNFSFTAYGGYFTLSALIFAGYSALSSLWSPSSDIERYIKNLFFLAVWLSGLAWLFSSGRVNNRRLYQVVIIVGVIASLVTVGWFYGYKGHSFWVRMWGLGLVENSTVVAQLFGVPALLAYVLLLRASALPARLLLLMSLLICMLPVLLSQTRGSLMALLVSALIVFIIIRPRITVWIIHIIMFAVALGLASLVIDWELLFQRRGPAFSYRDVIWLEVLSRVPENFFFGLGIEHKAKIIIPDQGLFDHSHNSWLDILYYSGALGVALAVWHLLLLFRSAVLSADELPMVAWLLFGCVCLFTNGSHLLTAPDAQWWVYWVPAGLLAAQITRRRLCQQS